MDDACYKLIEFTNETHNGRKSVDFVPSTWIIYDFELDTLSTKFMPPPYDEENSALLHTLIKCKGSAPESWPTYAIAIRGEARSYEEAVRKLQILNERKFAYSSDTDNAGESKAIIATEAYKRKNVLCEDRWQVPEMVDSNKNLTSGTCPSINQTRKANPKQKYQKNMSKPNFGSKCDVSNPPATVLFNELIPVMNSDCSLEDIKAVIDKGFHSQTLQLTQISTQLEEIRNMMTECKIGNISKVLNFTNPAEKYNMELPVKSLEDFQTFDSKLETDEDFREDIMTNMWKLTNIHASMLQAIREIFKKFIARDVILQCTAVKHTGKKILLRKTRFFSCVQGVIFAKYKDDAKTGAISIKDFEQAVGKVINNAKDWDGNRSLRKSTM